MSHLGHSCAKDSNEAVRLFREWIMAHNARVRNTIRRELGLLLGLLVTHRKPN